MAVIIVDVCLFLAYSDLTCHIEDTWIGFFLVPLCHLVVRILNLEVAVNRFFHQQVFCCHAAHLSVSLQLFPVMWIFLRSGCHLVKKVSSQWGSQKLYKDWCLMNLQPIFSIFTSFLTQWNGRIIKSTKTRCFWVTQLPKTLFYQYSGSSFEFRWMWIFPWIKLSWHYCYIWIPQLTLAISLWDIFFL